MTTHNKDSAISGTQVLWLAPSVALELVAVPAGEFRMGSDEGDDGAWVDETPRHRQQLGAYWIGRHPVTVGQWRAFAQATGYRTAAEREGWGHIWTGSQWEQGLGADWQHPFGPDERMTDSHPVTQVNWDDAVAFCAWVSVATGRDVRLPTEVEWEWAARGADGRSYPWGNEPPDDSCCNYGLNLRRTTPVGWYSPQGDSPFGCTDMAGNVCEWTSSLYLEYPYDAADGREDAASRERRVPRGGCFVNTAAFVRAAMRFKNEPYKRFDYLGLRVCVAGA